MKKNFLVIGNPIGHSLSPKLHNHWIKKYKIDAIYEKKLLNNNEIENLIFNIREEKLQGVNVTVPFKKIVIPRAMTKFLLFGIVLFFGALLVYTFKILAISTFLYLCLIPVSYFHYKKIKKEKNIVTDVNESDDLEDIL